MTPVLSVSGFTTTPPKPCCDEDEREVGDGSKHPQDRSVLGSLNATTVPPCTAFSFGELRGTGLLYQLL